MRLLPKANKLIIRIYLASILLIASGQLKAVEVISDVKLLQEPISTKSIHLPQRLFLSIEINATAVNGIFYAEQFIDGRLILVESAWTASNLRLPSIQIPMDNGQFGYDIRSLLGANYTLDVGSQSIKITAPINAFGLTDLSTDINLGLPSNTAPLGAYLNYNLVSTTTTGNQGGNNYGAFVEGVVFNHYGSLLSSMLTSVVNDQPKTIRSETYFQKDMPSNMEKLIIGDSVSSAGSWSRPVRFGGINWSTDFSLKQGFISAATPSINGSAALPSTVDILIDNQKRLTDAVNAGPFQIRNFPTVNGAGQINVVVKDILGVETISTQSFYSTTRLLQNNLKEFSFEAGMERKNYGFESNKYDHPFVAGTYRRGFDGYTLEVRTEIQESRQAAGIEMASLIKKYAVMHFALASSKVGEQEGLHKIFGIERSSKVGNATLQVENYDFVYVQMGASTGEIKPRQRVLLGLGVNFYRNLWISSNVVS